MEKTAFSMNGTRKLWPTRSRRGVQTLELILVLPIVVLVTFAIFQFGLTMVLHHAVMSAATEGAREGGKGATPAQVGSVVETVLLTTHGLSVAQDSGVMVIVEDSLTVSCVGDTNTFSAQCPVATSITDPEEVKVTVLVEFAATAVPNFLDIYSLDFSGSRYEIASIALKE